MKIYLAGIVPGKGSPNNDRIGREQDLVRLCEENGVSYTRMLSFAYPKDARQTIEAMKTMASKQDEDMGTQSQDRDPFSKLALVPIDSKANFSVLICE